ADLQTKVHGKDLLVMAGEYTGAVMVKGVTAFVERYAPQLVASHNQPVETPSAAAAVAAAEVRPRPPSFCTGCPERPI
ncbi:hypothetical protein ACO1MK_15045, partial [Staphylococcus aureus]